MTKKEIKPSKTAQIFIKDFGESAGIHYWSQDQGFGPSVDIAEKIYLADKSSLENYVAKLENKIKRLKNSGMPDNEIYIR